MRKVKDNWFNRKFRKNKLNQYKKYQRIIGWYESILEYLKDAKTLEDLISIHKFMWEKGYQNNNLGPCEWGMFRTKDIPTMKPEEVFIGGIYGLSTKNIPFWNEVKDETWGDNGFGINPDTKLYDIIFNRYKRLLQANVEHIYNEWIFK